MLRGCHLEHTEELLKCNAVLSSIKDEKVKELLLNQIKLAAQMNF